MLQTRMQLMRLHEKKDLFVAMISIEKAHLTKKKIISDENQDDERGLFPMCYTAIANSHFFNAQKQLKLTILWRFMELS